MNRVSRIAELVGVACLLTVPTGCRQDAQLIIYNANVYTVDDRQPRATSFAIRAGRFVALGDSATVFRSFSSDSTLDVNGNTVLPGLIDAHGHLVNEGMLRSAVDLVGTSSFDEVVERLLAGSESLSGSDWLYGRGWDQNDWEVQRFPDRHDLDRSFPELPVWIERIDGHAILVNSAALRSMGMTRIAAMPDPPGGLIARDRDGNPTGLFVDTAEDIVEAAAPPPSHERILEAIAEANERAVRVGLTGVHDPGLRADTLLAYRQAAADGLLDVRVYAMIEGADSELDPFCRQGTSVSDGGHLRVGAVKLYADGALGSRGAALLEPYTDAPQTRGLLRHDTEELAELVERVVDCGLQPAVHAIGDRAVRTVLDAYQSATAGVAAAVRPRIEHAQVVDPSDIERFAAQGVVVVMQPTHATSDMYWAEKRLGPERLKGAYAWRTILDSGARVAFGSDFPVESMSPIAGFYAAITRQDATGWPEGGWMPDQRLSRAEALRAFTLDAAYAAFMEGEVGSISLGKLADFVILDRDVMAVPHDEILDTKVLATFVGGVKVFDASVAD